MIKTTFILILAVITLSCVKKVNNPEVTDDYVLIEFAARLEEEHYRIYPQPLENVEKKTVK